MSRTPAAAADEPRDGHAAPHARVQHQSLAADQPLAMSRTPPAAAASADSLDAADADGNFADAADVFETAEIAGETSDSDSAPQSGYSQGRRRVIENKHSTDVESTRRTRVCASL